MKTWNSLSKSGPAAAVLLAGVLILATGCVEDRVTYVRPVVAAPVLEPEPPPPPLVVMLPAPVVELPPAPPPAPMVPLRSAADLDRMLAPIALYPDPLLAQLLPAATLPAQVVLVDRYLREGGDLNQVDAQSWDNSLKALARYPATLRMLDDNLAWTTDLGQAFINQPADVMDSVQHLRAQARAVGNLQSTPQQIVLVNDGIIEIVPAAPEVIYVPVYQAEVVYVLPPPAPGRFHISFGAGLVVGVWLNHDCDWRDHEVIVWHHDHPRPADWWYRPPSRRERHVVVNNVTIVNNTTIVNENVTVWHPRTGGAVAARGDRGWGQQDVPARVRAGDEVSRPAQRDVRQPPMVVAEQKPVPPREVRPAPPVREVRPSQPEVQQPPVRPPEVRATPPREVVKPTPIVPSREVRPVPSPKEAPPAPVPVRETKPVKPPVAQAPAPETVRSSPRQPAPAREVTPAPRPNQPVAAPRDSRPVPAPVTAKPPSAVTSSPRPAVPPATAQPAAKAPARPPASALAGIESARVTREVSARGAQSHEAMAKPAAVSRPAPTPVPSPKANSSATKNPQKTRQS